MSPPRRPLADTAVALLIAGAAFALGPWRGVEPFHTYFYLFAWAPYLWCVFRWLAWRRPGHPWAKAGAVLRMMPWSVTVWLVFEVINFRLGNWRYHGVPAEVWLRWPGYAASFSTVLPAVLLTGALIDGRLGAAPETAAGRRPVRWLFEAGLLMIALPLAWPAFFFPLVWGFLFFLLDPLVEARGGHSLMRDWRERRFGPTAALLLAGFVCGGYWEMCNLSAGAKWTYHIPFVGFLKIFEMPVLGFLGFPAFALELHAAHEFALTRGRWTGRTAAAAQVVFWLLAFAGIDRFTVVR